MSDSKKTKQQLIDELNALRAKMDSAGSNSATEIKSAVEGQGTGQATGLTRRDVLTAWVAPVILTVPLMPRMAAAAGKPGNQVQGDPTQVPGTGFPTQFPSQFPTSVSPTSQPTGSPTSQPTGSPTGEPTPGQTPAPVQPTVQPTPKPTLPPPSPFPTITPTAVIPVELSEFKID